MFILSDFNGKVFQGNEIAAKISVSALDSHFIVDHSACWIRHYDQ